MKLNELVADFAQTSLDIEISGLTLDSHQVKLGDVFIALAGSKQHGLSYACQVLKKGACAIIYAPEGGGDILAAQLKNTPLIKIEQLAFKLADIAAHFYDYPTQKLAIVGITGTNGKTSCSQFLAQILPKTMVIGTLGWGELGQLKKTDNTTPNALTLQSILAQCVNDKKTHVMLEVSSHGLALGRVQGLKFKGAVFTNLSQDHLDYHHTMEAYFQAKLNLFKQAELTFAVINLDDAYSLRIVAALSTKVSLWTFSLTGKTLEKSQCVLAKNIQLQRTGLRFDVDYGHHKATVCCHFYGRFNVENILAVMTTLLAMGASLTEATKKASVLEAIPGRMEFFGGHGLPHVFVDYAHTPDALAKALTALKEHQYQHVSLVFGCGGDRDKGKRKLMGHIACQHADSIIVTDDNPRHEKSQAIIGAILAGCQPNKVRVIDNRKQAIKTAITQASGTDCILIAGKGHENYQEIKGVKYPFSDQAIVQQVLQQWTSQ